MTPDTLALVLSNIGLVAVTGWLIYVTIRESNRHAEVHARSEDEENARLTAIIDHTMALEQRYAHETEKEEIK